MIQYFDAIFILVLNIRSILAILSLRDEEKVELYSRVRLVTFWFQWIVLFLLVVGFAFYTVFEYEEESNRFLLLSLAELTVLLLASLIDFHFCKVTNSKYKNQRVYRHSSIKVNK